MVTADSTLTLQSLDGFMQTTHQLLLVEDEEAHAEVVRRAFEPHSELFHLTVVSTLQEAAEALDTLTFSLVIADWNLPDGHGIELLSGTRVVPLLLMTSHGNEQLAVDALRRGAVDYVVKSDTTLRDMPHIATRAIRHWDTIVSRQHVEDELRRSEEKFRSLSDFSPVGIFYTNLAGLCLYTNRALRTITGLTLQESLGAGWTDTIHPDDRERVAEQWNRCVEARDSFALEFRFSRLDGTDRWVLARLQPVVVDGNIVGYVGTDEDITDRKGVEDQLTARLRSRELLLEELCLSVTSSVQVFGRLLESQRSEVTNLETDAMQREGQTCIQALSLLCDLVRKSGSPT
ncbi:MAG: PAS domain S-box protein [Bryobacteraceae bacterium]|nr:PAS domain S-box protein [Bryobacteraceae bacterium]